MYPVRENASMNRGREDKRRAIFGTREREIRLELRERYRSFLTTPPAAHDTTVQPQRFQLSVSAIDPGVLLAQLLTSLFSKPNRLYPPRSHLTSIVHSKPLPRSDDCLVDV